MPIDLSITAFLTHGVRLANVRTDQRRFAPILAQITEYVIEI